MKTCLICKLHRDIIEEKISYYYKDNIICILLCPKYKVPIGYTILHFPIEKDYSHLIRVLKNIFSNRELDIFYTHKFEHTHIYTW